MVLKGNKMKGSKNKKTNKKPPILTKKDFLKVLDRDINPQKPPDSKRGKTHLT